MIRKAELRDLPYLLEIEKLSFLLGDRFNRYQFWCAMQKGKGKLLVYVRDLDIPVGYIYILKPSRIYSLAVHPAARNERIGKTLLKKAEIFCKDKLKVTLEVRIDNINAQRFYMKNGYKYNGIRHNYYADGTDAIVMKKDLSNAK